MHTRESITKELKRIQDSVPQLLKDFTLQEVESTPTIKLMVEKALESDEVTEERKKQLKSLLDNGYFSKKKIVENTKVAQQRDNFVKREINKSVKEGRLPTKKELKELKLMDLHG